MPKRIKMKKTKIATLNRSDKELTRVPTSLLILGIAFTLLRGLSTLRFLRDFKLTPAILAAVK